jgi:hypothetical protein
MILPLWESLATLLSRMLRVNVNIGYERKRIEHIFRYEVNRFNPCQWTIISKRKHFITKPSMTVHVDGHGHAEWEEIG